MKLNLTYWVLPVSVACAGTSLPSGWEEATQLAVVQTECMSQEAENKVDAAVDSKGVSLLLSAARFRCEQRVEGFLRVQGDALDVLFQPEDMDPSSVPKCDCLYDLETTFTAAPGVHGITIWQRNDRHGADKEPTPRAVGNVTVSVP